MRTVLALALHNLAEKWTRPIRDLQSAVNQFSIMLHGRLVTFWVMKKHKHLGALNYVEKIIYTYTNRHMMVANGQMRAYTYNCL